MNLHQRNEVEFVHLQSSSNFSNEFIVFDNQGKKSDENQVRNLHHPTGEKSSQTYGIASIPHFNDSRVNNIGDDVVIVVPDVMIQDDVTQNFNQCKNSSE